MPPLYRILEVALYSLLNFLPYMVLALYPFRNQLRFSRVTTILLVILITVVQIDLGILAAFSGGDKGVLSAASTIIYALFYFTAVKARFGKTLFTLLMLSNISNFVVICAKCLEGLVFGEIAYETYRWTNSLFMIIVHLVTTVPLGFYFHKHYSIGINRTAGSSTWNYLWLIPATFYLLWYHHAYGGTESALEIALSPHHTLFLLAINLGAFLTYHMLIRLIRELETRQALETKNHQLTLQTLQHENLRERIAEARQAKHDIRHHILVMNEYLKSQKYDELEMYLKNYQRSLPDDSSIVFCSHYATNTLLLYFAQQAKNSDVDFSVSVHLPEQISLPDHVLSVVLGNLLENAFEASASVPAALRRITVRGKADARSVFFEIDNTYNSELIRDKNGYYLSTKHEGRGVGLSSVRAIATQYDGLFEIEQKENVFCASILLNIPEICLRQ